MRKLRILLRKLEYALEDGANLIINDTLITVGRFVFDMFTLSVSLFYAVTNTLPVIPQWAWAGIFVFMLIAGTCSLEDLVYLGYDEDGNKIDDEGDVEEPEDDEIVED